MHTVYIKTFVKILQEVTLLKYPPEHDHTVITDQIFGQRLLGVYSTLRFWHFDVKPGCMTSHSEMKDVMSQDISFSAYVPELNHLDIVGWVKPLPPVVLNPPTPALIILILDLQKLLTCGETEPFIFIFFIF